MTEYELLTVRELMNQSITALADAQASYVAIYLSMVFAYTTVAYVVGSKLTKLQTVIVTAVYSLSSLYAVLVIVAMTQGMIDGQFRMADIFEEIEETSDAVAMTLWLDLTIWPLAMVASLIFMWFVRRDN